MTEFEAGSNNKEYKVDRIWNNSLYAKKSVMDHLPDLYYLVAWKCYPEKENIWGPASIVQYLRKLIGTFYKDNPNKLIAISPLVNTATPIA